MPFSMAISPHLTYSCTAGHACAMRASGVETTLPSPGRPENSITHHQGRLGNV
jgi:hypothetical protein